MAFCPLRAAPRAFEDAPLPLDRVPPSLEAAALFELELFARVLDEERDRAREASLAEASARADFELPFLD